MFHLFSALRVVSFAKGAARIVALFLKGTDLAVEAGENVHHLREGSEIFLDVIGAGYFLEDDLGEARGGGLKANLGQFGGILAAKEIQDVILIEAVMEDGILLELPFEIATAGPIGNVTFRDGEIEFVEGSDNIFVGNAVGDHPIDHVTLEFWEGSYSTTAPGFVARGLGRDWPGVNDCGRLIGCELLGHCKSKARTVVLRREEALKVSLLRGRLR